MTLYRRNLTESIPSHCKKISNHSQTLNQPTATQCLPDIENTDRRKQRYEKYDVKTFQIILTEK